MRVAQHPIHPFSDITSKRVCALHGYGACVTELVCSPESGLLSVMAVCLQAHTGARTGDGQDHLYAV